MIMGNVQKWKLTVSKYASNGHLYYVGNMWHDDYALSHMTILYMLKSLRE